MILIVNPQYNPDFEDDITSKTKLGPGISLAKFLGAKGSRTQLDTLYAENFFGAPDKRQIARNLVLHSQVIQSVISNSFFSRHRLVVSEGIYEPNPKFTVEERDVGSEAQAKKLASENKGSFGKGPNGWIARIPTYIGERPTAGSINDLRRTGRAVVYQLVDKKGKSDPQMSFDLAVYLKDYCSYDKLTLDYDTFDPSGDLTCSIILEMPKVPTTYDLSFKFDLETTYNGELQSKDELLEILPEVESIFDFFS
tara:strand:- start:1515 stop:2273 length:759 start_codon:yes stop_codon:yes gene_type:complete